jgi:hypothetical protein
MITMNRTTRAAHRFRGTSAGVVAAVMMFGLADLIARAFTPSAAPLLTLGQAIIPLAPPAAIKPVIALFGDNDKLVLVVSTGLGALVLAGLIGALAASRRRLATTLLLIAGLVPLIVIVLRPEAGALDIIPTLIGIAGGVAVFVVLLRFGVPATHAEAADGVEQTVIDRAESDRTVSALKILPEEQSTPIVMAFYQGMTHAQIPEDLKVPLGTIKSRIRDGMKKLRDELEASR